MSGLRCLLAACAILLALGHNGVHAAVPASGTLSPANPLLTYVAGPFTSVNVSPQLGDPNCALFPNSCDDYTLTVTVSAAYMAANPDHVVTIKVQWPTPQYDFDVYLQNPATNTTITSSASSSDPEIIVFSPQVGTTVYRIRTLAFATVNESFQGRITLGPRETGTTRPATYGASPDVFTCNTHLGGQSTVFDHGNDGEPAVKFDNDGNAWVTGIAGLGGGLGLWKIPAADVCAQAPIFYDSPDAGVGGGDTDIEIAPERNALGNYNIYTSSLTLANITSSTSLDNGNTFVPVVVSDPTPVNDRQFNAAYGASTVFLSWRTLNTGNQLFCARSDNAGLSFGPPVPVYDDVVGTTLATQLGNLVCDTRPGATAPIAAGADGEGNLYHGYILTTQDASSGHKIYVAVSRDFGLTWTSSLVFAGPPGATFDHIFSWIAVDGAGNVYTVWADGNNVYYSGSSDLKTTNAATWSLPVRVNNGAATKTCVLPMVDAGSDGRIVVAWYGTDASSSVSPGAQWHYFHARCNNALGALPVIEQVRVSDHVMHTGVVCEDGLGCSCCRELLECQELDVNPVDGSSLVSYAGAGGIYITRQVAGVSAIAGRSIVDNSGPCPTLTDNPPCAAQPVVESSCILPGIRMITDPAGDVTALGGPGHDIEGVWVAEPWLGPGVNQLVFTMKVASINPASPPLLSTWYMLFTVPGATNPRKWVAMETCDATAIPTFSYGYLDPTLGFQAEGAATGTIHGDNTIEIRLPKNLVGNPAVNSLLQTIEGDVRVFLGAQCTGLVSRVDGAAGGHYTVRGNTACIPHTVTCPAPIDGPAGSDQPATFTVHNPSSTARAFDVTIADTEGWLVGGPFATTVGPVSPGSSASLNVVVRMPGNCVPLTSLITFTAVADDLPPGDSQESCNTTALCQQATATLVSRFDARRVGRAVELTWSAHADARFTGWNLYRRPDAAGAWARVNSELIRGAGAQFRWMDDDAPGGEPEYRLAVVETGGAEQTVAHTTLAGGGRPADWSFAISGPNPFAGSTSITYALPQRSAVRIEVFSVTGQRLRTLVDLAQEPGTYTVPFSLRGGDGIAMGPGLYLVRFTAGDRTESRRVIAIE